MQQYLPPSGSDQWHSPILEDISFIRRRLRYPLNRRTSAPAITMAILLLAMTTIIIAITRQFSDGIKISIVPTVAALLVIAVFIVRLFRSFYFISITTGYSASDNIKALESFLAAKQILVFHHPDAPEVFQIISRPLDGFKGKREVMIFIADDKRILINSHFVPGSGDAVQPVGASNHHRMAAELKKWMETKVPGGHFIKMK